jgi:WD40 repeat protein
MKPIIHRKPKFCIPNSTLALSPSNVLPIILSLFFLSQAPVNHSPLTINNSSSNTAKLELVIQNGHTSPVNGIQLTKDGKKLISYSSDRTIKIWDIQEGKLLKILEGISGSALWILPQGIQLTKDEKKLIYFHSSRNVIMLWDFEKGKLIKELKGHTEGVNGIRLTSNGTRLISYSDDKTVRIWDLEKGELLKTLEGHTGRVNGIQLTKSESQVISYSDDKIIKIWDLGNGKLLKTLEGHTERVNGVHLMKSESQAISYSDDKTIKIWDLENGKLLKSLDGHTERVNGIHLMKPENQAISYSDDKTLKIWDLEKRKLLKTLEGHSKRVNGIHLINSESLAISYSDDNTIKIWEWETGKLLKTLNEHTRYVGIQLTNDERRLISYSGDGTIKTWEMETGKPLRTLEGHTNEGERIQLTKDGRKIISYFNSNPIKIWGMETGKLLKSLEGHRSGVKGIQLTKDEKKLIFYFYNNRIKIWEMETGKLLQSLEGHPDYVNGIQLTKDEKKLISYSSDRTIKIWETETGKLLKTLEGHFNSVNGIQLTNDEIKLFSYSDDGTIKIWETETGKLFRTLAGHTKWVHGIQLTNDEIKLISYSGDKTIKIWEMETGRLLKSLEGHTDSVYGIHLTKDERKLISYSYDKTIKIWDMETGKLLQSLDGHLNSIKKIQITKDEKKIISYSGNTFGSNDKTIKIWDMETGTLLQSLEGHTGDVYGIQLTKDEKKLISKSADNTIKIWDISEVKTHGRASLLQTLNHQSSSIINYILQSTPAYPNLLLSFSADGSLRYWDMDTGKLLLTQLLFKEGESIYYTADGYFDFTDKKVMDYIAYTSPSIQSGFIDLQDLWEDYKRDDLKESVLAGRFKPKKGSNLIRSVETTPVIKTLFDPQKTIAPDKDNYPMRIQVSEKGSKLGSVVVFVNGVQVVNTKLSEESNENGIEVEESETSGGKSFQLKFPVPLNYGTNRVEIKAYNEFGIPQSYPAFDLERKTPANVVLPKPNLYVLSVGVNEYQKNKLKFSVKDAEAMAEVLSKNGKELYSAIHVKKLLDKDASKKGIEDALADIARNAKPEDVVLIYLSGHGNNASSREVKNLFYFVPFDFNWSSDSQAEYVAREQGIDAEYLNETFTKIKSHKVILILDACHSGSIQTAMLAKGEDETKASRKAMDRMANGTGRFIFASSAGNELSREHSEAGHGLYTYVLLNALGKNTDKKIPNADYINSDGFIYLSEIRSYIEQKFEDQTEKYLTGVRQSPPSMSLGRTGMHERVNDFPLLKVK